MRSIQTRLILALTAAAVTLMLGVGLTFYGAVRHDLVRQFDRSLEADAEAWSSLVQFQPDGSVEFEYDPAVMPSTGGSREREQFAIFHANGKVLATSRGWRDLTPPLAAHLSAADVPISKGKLGRALRLDFIPHLDPDSPVSGNMRTWTGAPLSVVVARDRGDLDATLQRFLLMLVAAAFALAVSIVLVVVFVVRRGLRPLRDMGDRAAVIGPAELHLRLPEHGMPAELMPICACLNDLLKRLHEAFARERRFTSDVAHELRTPIAELRLVTDIAIRHPGDSALAQSAVRDGNDIARQMQTLVNTLLSLVRSETAPSAALQAVPLRATVDRVIRELAVAPADIDCDIPGDISVMAEPALLASSLRNVLANAVEYRSGTHAVRCTMRPHSGGAVRLSVENDVGEARLTSDDVSRLFEPFWRKDAARTDGTHAGLGLTLVRAYCQLMDVEITAEIYERSKFRVRFTFTTSTTSADIAPTDRSQPSLRLESVVSGGAEHDENRRQDD